MDWSSASEHLVQSALEHLQEGRTTLVIAHRLSTIRDADRIVVLDHGQIVESGTHDELMGRSGTYARLVARQAALESSKEGDSEGGEDASSELLAASVVPASAAGVR